MRLLASPHADDHKVHCPLGEYSAAVHEFSNAHSETHSLEEFASLVAPFPVQRFFKHEREKVPSRTRSGSVNSIGAHNGITSLGFANGDPDLLTCRVPQVPYDGRSIGMTLSIALQKKPIATLSASHARWINIGTFRYIVLGVVLDAESCRHAASRHDACSVFRRSKNAGNTGEDLAGWT